MPFIVPVPDSFQYFESPKQHKDPEKTLKVTPDPSPYIPREKNSINILPFTMATRNTKQRITLGEEGDSDEGTDHSLLSPEDRERKKTKC